MLRIAKHPLLLTMEAPKHCHYCGDWYDCRDHVIPVSYTHIRRAFKGCKTVPACTMCNSLLSSFLFASMEERSAYLFDKYQSRYRRVLKLPVWTEQEVSELDYGMRSVVEGQQHAKRIVMAKLANLALTSEGEEPVSIPAMASHAEAMRVLKG